MTVLQDRLAGLSPEQRALFEKLREKQRKAAARSLQRAQPPPVPRVSGPTGEGEWPLSLDQERFWFMEQLYPGGAGLNISAASRMRGPLSVPAVAAALDEIVRRHAAWRTAFPVLDGAPVQRVAPPRSQPLALLDLSGLPEERKEPEVLHLLTAATAAPFPLETGPLVRSALVRLGPRDHVCILTVHHLVTDWISFQIAFSELAAIYAGRSAALPPPPIQYPDFAIWQRSWLQGEVLDGLVSWWREQLAGFPLALELPTDRPRPAVVRGRGGRRVVHASRELSEAVRSLARREGATLFMTVLAATAALLHRLSGQEKLILGANNANRNRPELEPVLGCFLTQVPFPIDLTGDPTFRELLARVRKSALGALAHQDLPFGKLVEAIQPERDTSRQPLVQALVQVLDGQASKAELAGVEFEPVDAHDGNARYDLMLTLFDYPEGLAGSLEHDSDLFDPTTAERLAGLLFLQMESVAADPELRLSELPVLSDGARHQALVEWNDTARPLPGWTLPERFAAQAARTPDAVAVIAGNERFTYGEIDRRSDDLARCLGVEPDSRVALLLGRTPDVPIAILAAWKAGAAYVPLDPEWPAGRLETVLADAEPALLVHRGPLPAPLDVPALDLDAPGTAGQGELPAFRSERLAYLIYTSGTTGMPKAVMVEHGSVAAMVGAILDRIDAGPDERVPHLSRYTFDVSLLEIFVPLLAGGICEIVQGDEVLEGFLDVLERSTRVFTVPALLRRAVAEARERRFAGLRTLTSGGDLAPPDLLEELLAAFPSTDIQVLYGPTETSIICTGHRLSRTRRPERALIGRPLDGVEARVLDPRGQPVPLGVPGELWIGGPGVARGYFRRQELTAERFVEVDGRRFYRTGDLVRQVPSEGGELEFLGRVDDQVKVRGFRIEPGEIEAALLDHPAVREAVVMALPSGGDKQLVAWVVGTDDAEALRTFLRSRLPDYMVPAVFVPLDALPISAHGKVERKALPAPGAAASAGSAAPRNAREELLAGIWREALGLERVGIHDNFFQLGGDSILSIQIVARARRAGLQLTTRQFFDNQTIAGLAAVAGVTADAEVEEWAEGEAPLTPVQRRFFAEGRREPWRFNQAVLLASRERLETPRLAAALERLARHHDALRLRFVQEADGWRQFYAPAAPVPLLEVDLPPEALEAALEQLQSGLNLQHGPLFTAALFHLGAEDRLLLTAHHLIVDAVSWRVLLEDLTAEKLPPKTTSWKRWAELLAAFSVEEEIPYWQAIPAVPPLPVDADGEGGRATLTVELGAAETRALLRDAPEVYRTQVNDLLLAALARAFASWTGEGTLLVDLEGHGREEIFPGVDLSRTVGWFTTLFPVALRLGPGAGPRESILAVKETLRAVPGRGLGYGLLRDRLSVPEPQVSFNYLGRFDQPAGEDGPFTFAPETVRGTEGEAVPGRHLFAIDLLVLDDRLRATWTYDPGRHLPATAERLARSFLAELEGLVVHCLSPEAGGYSPSDFPLAGLDQAALDRLEPGVEDLYPLAPLQEGILFHSLYDPRADPYLEQLTARLEGPLDAPAFAAAWQRVVERHAALRTAFLWKTVDRSLQLVRRRAELPWTVQDWPGEAGWQELLAADRARGFDLDRAPLMRLTLVRMGESSHRLIWTAHHLIFDGWGFPLILSEVFAFYQNPGLQLPPARSYRDFIAWLAQRDDSEAESHWREALRGFTEPTPLPFDHAAGAGDPVERGVTLPAGELGALAQRLQVPLNILVQGAWALLLSRYSQAMDVVFGAVVSGRPAELAGVESIVGLFINTVPVRARIPEDEPASAWLKRFQAEQVGLRQYQWTPLSRVQALSEVPPGEPLFASLLAFENYPIDPSVSGHLGELRIVDAELDERTNYPLGLTAVARGGDLSLRLTAHPRFEPATVERLVAHLGNLLQALAADPERLPRDLPMFSEGELRQVLADWNHTAGPVPDWTLPERFAAQAARTPDAVAVIAGDERLTYDEIDRRSDELARCLHVEPDSRVALLLGRTLDVPVAILAAWKAGAAYIPLDPEWPAERLRTVLADAEPALLIHRGPLPVSLDVPALDLAEPGAPGDGELPGFRPDRLAYLIYTSGTTGRPKAVMVEHGSVAAMVGAVLDRIGAGPDERVPHLSRYTFDVSLLELFAPLLSGGVCEIVESDEVLDPAGFLDVLERSTRVFTLPALLRRAAAAAKDCGPQRFAGLRTLASGGDLAAPDLLEELLAAFPSTAIEVLYGPTETAIVCTGHRLRRARRPDRALIGRPLAGVVARVVDPRGQLVPLGVPGELWIGGPGVARGYFRRDDLTAERFVEVDGCRFYRTGDLVRHVPSAGGDLEFLGRVDDQVKVRGFRIEPGEIEAALLDHPGVREAVVMALPSGGDKQLVAWVVGTDDAEALRAFLRGRLPAYMLPAVFVPLDALPISAHGKVDRKALPAPGAVRAALAGSAVPRNAREELLAGIWREVLGRERVGIHDNFFQLGGDSILSIQIVARARRAGLQLTTRQFFDNQTIAGLAAVAGIAEEEVLEERVEGEVPLTPVQRRFFAEGRREPWRFNQAVLLASRERLETPRLAAALERLARHHDALRLRFVQEAHGWRQFYAPAAPVPLLEVDLPPEALEAAVEQLQSGLHLQHGPLFTAALFHLGTEDRLLLTAHHLIVDAVSWRVLLEDLTAENLPPKTTSWKRWAELLAASSSEEEIPYWQAIPSVPPLPVDMDGERERATLTVELGAAETRALLQDAPRVYRTQANDLLLAALARAFASWTGERTLLVDLEGHGREEIFPGVDLSRTVGWFTTLFPAALRPGPGAGPRESILAVKETLRAVPGRGLGFGLLRERLSVPEPQVAFNYLGRFDAPSGPFAFAPEAVRGTGGEAVPGRHLFAIDLMVLDDRLHVTWTYDPGRHLPATAERLARGFLAELEALAAHCLSEAGGWSPSDFPLAGLDQAALDRLERGVEDLYPLAPLQEGLLFHSLYHPGADPYLEQLTARLEGPLDAPAFAAAWQRVVERHAALRTAFLWQGVDRPLQLVRREAELPWSVQDWHGEAWWEDLLAADRARGFDLSRAPLLRLTLVRTGERSHRLVWTSHHLIFDGWGFPLILSEVFAFYQNPGLQLPPARPYRDFIAWLAQRDDSDAERHWREALRGFAEPTSVPFDHAAGAGDPVERSATLPAGELEALAQRLHVTLNTLVQGAWALLLSRYAQVSEVVFGAVVSGRPAELPGVESIVGLFINTVPVRVAIPEDESASTWLARLQEDQVGLRLYQWTPLSRIQALSEVPAGEPLFASLLAFENYPVVPSVSGHLGELRIVEAELSESTNYPLTLTVVARGDLSVRLAADRRFEPATVERLLAHLGNLLQALAANLDRPPRELPMLSEGERRQVLVDWNDTAVPFPDRSIPELFAEQAALRPDAVAVEQGDVRLTWRELQERAERLARHLRLQPEQRVAVLAERSTDLIVNLLAILQAGGAYLPLDPAHPQERRDWMMRDAGAAMMVLEETESELPRVPPDSLAYVMYTSGSTGAPKGVAVTHRNVVRLVRGADYAEMDHAWLQFAPVSFDASTLEIWGPLLNGGRLVLFPGRLGSLEELARVIERHGVTSAWLTAGLFHEMVDGRLDGLRPLRQLLAGGDVISPDHARRVREVHPGLALINGYGPTEGTTFTCCHRVLTMEETVGETVPIGRPIANSRAYVLDGRMDPQPLGAWGELYAGGDGLARGYLGRPDLTAERFGPDPFGREGERLYRTGDRVRWRADGTLEFQGRLDSQLKIRGFRVEPAEVEAALLACPGVTRGAIAVTGKSLAAFWVGEAQADELRARLRERLPEAMVPSIWVPVPDLPLTPNGKVDRRALAALATPSGAPAVERVPPGTPLEKDLVKAWAAVLERDPGEIGVLDNFFDLGGHSLLATRLASRLQSRHGLDVPIHLLFDTRNLAELAGRIQERLLEREPAPGEAIPRRPEDLDPIPVSFAQERLWFLDRLTPGSPAYNIPVALRLSGDLDVPALERAFAEVTGRHEALRTTFAERGGTPVQRIAPPAGWTIPVADLSDVYGPAGASLEAERLAREDALTPFDLARGPLLRTRLLRLAPREHVLLLCLHHTVADLWSMEILVKEVATLYSGRPLPELPIQYADFAIWQRERLSGAALAEQIAFWREELAGAPPALELPTDRPRPAVPSHRGATLPVAFGPELSAAVTRLGREHGATPFMVLLAALGAVCSRWSGQDDLVLGSPIANRQRTELEGLIGMFVNTLPLRVRTHGGPSFAQLLRRVRRTALAAYEHQDVPFEKLVEELHPPRDPRAGGRHPLFQVMLSVQNVRQERLQLPGLVLEPLEAGSTIAKFDLTLTLSEEDGALAGNVEWATDLFDAGTVERLAGEVQALLAAAAGAPDAPLAGLPVLSEGEALQLRPAGERPQPPQSTPPRNPLEENLVEAAAAALGRDPGTIGIFDNFFDLGGHSLLATRFVSQLYQRWGIDVPLQLVFDVPHLAGLADAILERELGEADDELMNSLLAEMKGDE